MFLKCLRFPGSTLIVSGFEMSQQVRATTEKLSADIALEGLLFERVGEHVILDFLGAVCGKRAVPAPDAIFLLSRDIAKWGKRT